MTKKTGIAFLFIFSVLTLSLLAPIAKTACAGNAVIAEQTCDTGVWAAMSARARMETEREVMQNQNLIFKPDSILSYVCFDSFAGHAAQNVGNLFTHTGYRGWGLPRGGNTGMDTAMNNVVINSMNTYITNNFNHSLLGGRGQEVGLAANAPPVQGSQTSYACQVMAQVWQKAKCMNFMHTAAFVNTDGFYPFIDMAGINADPVAGYQSIGNVRAYPANMSCGADEVVPGGWNEIYRLSRNEGTELYVFQNNVNATYAAVRELIQPGECGDPIATGVSVMLSPSSTTNTIYADGVCTNPGCSYAKGDGAAIGTCTTNPAVVQ